MSWKDSIRKKGSRSMSSHAAKYIDEIMSDNQSRTLREVMEALYELKNSKVDYDKRNFSNITPTTRELEHYFSSSAIYQKAGRDEFTDKLRYKRV